MKKRSGLLAIGITAIAALLAVSCEDEIRGLRWTTTVCDPACGAGLICVEGQCVSDCDPACTDGKVCVGSNQCVFQCDPACTDGKVCVSPNQCEYVCTPECAFQCLPACTGGKVCVGPNQCAFQCDPACTDGKVCVGPNQCAFQCEPACTDGKVCVGTNTCDYVCDPECESGEECVHNKGSTEDSTVAGFKKAALLMAPLPNSSSTRWEYPVVADIDNDGSTEFLVVANDYECATSGRCETRGIRAFRDKDNRWAPSRRIWNQHTYHITNVNENGSIPQREKANWLVNRLNNFRQTLKFKSAHNASNLQPGVGSFNFTTCDTDHHILLTGIAKNVGSLAIKSGLRVEFFVLGAGNVAHSIGIATLTTGLGVGQSAALSLEWDGKVGASPVSFPAKVFYRVDTVDDTKTEGDFIECNEKDNTSDTFIVYPCPPTR